MRHTRTKATLLATALLAAVACSDSRTEVTPPVGAASASREADNTARNVRDRAGATLTPEDQSNSPADLALTQKIRQDITSADAMSLQARNVKVIAQNGVVTLRGPVKTEEEKAAIESLAKDAGATSVDNQLEIDRDNAPGEEE